MDEMDITEVAGEYDLEGDLMSDPGTPFDRLLEAKGLSRKDAVAVIVDDDEGVLETMPDILMLAFNVKVETAAHGKRGLVVLEKNLGRTCLVLSDTNMPYMDGPDMLRAARERGLLQRMPVVIMTADYGRNTEEINAITEDGVAHESLLKPFAPYELIDAVNKACLQILNDMKVVKVDHSGLML